MTISYHWLSSYLPGKIEPEKLEKILTSIGLEVEGMHAFSSVKGALQGLVTGEVLSCEKHPGADKLKITSVNIGLAEPLQIVCGAANVATGQKVIVAPVGTTLYPMKGEPMLIKKAKIRGEESAGMICAEDEIGLGENHDGILVLPEDTEIGKPLAGIFPVYEDIIIEIGLTPNRMDAMSHLGVAKDVCAWLSHHERKETKIISPFKNGFKADNHSREITVHIENHTDCKRYAGVSISGIEVKQSPDWLIHRLQSIGIKAINNIVDITNFILHETGQPLHAFDADKIKGNSIVVKSATPGSSFVCLDNKEIKLTAADLVISNATDPMCIAGVYGGLDSGVTAVTKNIFLESAWFNPAAIRKTSLQHNLRTDAAARFEKGVDISNTVTVLKRAALLIKEIAGGSISSDIVDVYPVPAEKKTVGLKYHYLKKLSGKNYHSEAVKTILQALGFEIMKDNIDELWVSVPHSKPDIYIPADIVEEIVRIDGLDNIEISSLVQMTPAKDVNGMALALQEKISETLSGLGFHEIFTNSLTNSRYYDEEAKKHAVRLLNSLSLELDIMRPQMLDTGLEVLAYNLNRKNNRLLLYEFGKTYHTTHTGNYEEQNHLTLFAAGILQQGGWQHPQLKTDFYYLKAICNQVFARAGISKIQYEGITAEGYDDALEIKIKNKSFGLIGIVSKEKTSLHHIKEEVFVCDINWQSLLEIQQQNKIEYKEISKFPAVERDLALVIDRNREYAEIENAVTKARINQLQSIKLFDIFESEKIGAGKKSMAVSFTFRDEDKTLTDKEIDEMMNRIIDIYQKELGAEIRK